MKSLAFIKEFIAKPAHVGAIVPSSRYLAELMTDTADVSASSVIVEFGPGTGVFTKSIVRKKPDNAIFLAIEINPEFVAMLRKQFPGVSIINDCAENTRAHLERRGVEFCDCVVSGLPWASFDDDLQDSLLCSVQDILRPGGKFVTFTYIQSPYLKKGRRFRDKLFSSFKNVETTRKVWRNIPPAFAYCAEK